MRGMLAAILATATLAGAAAPALAKDGHGNASNPERTVPNTGGVAGGPAHRDDPRVREAQERGPDGKPAHGAGDGHAHGHSQDKSDKR
ncbi:hypothetical protein H0176_24370 [Methylorubrum populi]|uniref:hypothetical protein n=1 Tax=Methylorubrum rhodesianum TaxID=29427 RepID=UPI00190A2851|nr:hypothetical protein [Methylorubrum rhodesianum]MBK3406599.1 hypothetical protein [Methylorubrum rhodesianum]MBY0143372.1 hypothetical protein [Methylorubrum populi]